MHSTATCHIVSCFIFYFVVHVGTFVLQVVHQDVPMADIAHARLRELSGVLSCYGEAVPASIYCLISEIRVLSSPVLGIQWNS